MTTVVWTVDTVVGSDSTLSSWRLIATTITITDNYTSPTSRASTHLPLNFTRLALTLHTPLMSRPSLVATAATVVNSHSHLLSPSRPVHQVCCRHWLRGAAG